MSSRFFLFTIFAFILAVSFVFQLFYYKLGADMMVLASGI